MGSSPKKAESDDHCDYVEGNWITEPCYRNDAFFSTYKGNSKIKIHRLCSLTFLILILLIAWIEKLLKDRLPLRKLRKPFVIVEVVKLRARMVFSFSVLVKSIGHPLKLIDHLEKPGGAIVDCDICEESISVAYACVECQFVVIEFLKGFFYRATIGGNPGFNACANCFLVEFACKAEYDAIKEKATIKLQHEGHPQHTLTLQLRHGAFRCDACKTDEKGLFYQCDSCDFWIHETCAFLPPTIDLPHHHPKHPLVLVYSLPERFYKYNYYCKFCNEYIRRKEWLYHCGNYRYFAHIKCALNAQKKSASTPRDDPSTSAASDDVHSLLRFPMPEAFSDPLKILHSKILAQHDKETTEISHWSHPAHPLILNVEDSQGNNNMMPDINSG
ncbi:C1-like protein, partial [Tanacetum coccineum]